MLHYHHENNFNINCHWKPIRVCLCFFFWLWSISLYIIYNWYIYSRWSFCRSFSCFANQPDLKEKIITLWTNYLGLVVFYSVINKIDKFFYFILCISFCYADVLSITTFNNETLIISREEDHINYGLSYPVTYEFHIPQDATDLYAYRKYQTYQDWNLIDIKTANDFFNGIEAVRFDYTENIAYVSAYFSSFSDSIFIQIVNSDNNRVDASFNKITNLIKW